MCKAFYTFFYIELILLLRRSQEWLYPIGFFIIIICLFPLAFTPDPNVLVKLIPGGIWIAALLASLLSVQAVFANELEEGNMDQLLLASFPLSLYVLAKLCAHWVVSALPLILLVPLISVIFHLSESVTIALMCSLIVGTPILLLIGSLMAALTSGLRQQGVLLGLLMMPLVTPVLIFGVNLAQQSASGISIAGPIAFLAGLAVFAILLIPIAIAGTLRVCTDN